jgi:tetratricopeptide (TPR) repeat protein
MYKFLFLLLCFFCVEFVATAQNQRKLDSLNSAYNVAKHDTTEILILYDIALEYRNSKADTALQIALKALEKSEKIKFKKGISGSLNIIGIIYQNQNNYPLSLEYYKKSLKIKEEIGDKIGIAANLNNT